MNALRTAVALALVTSMASACPSCSLAQAGDTLLYIIAFMATPYLLVSGSVVWIKSLLDEEEEDEGTPDHL